MRMFVVIGLGLGFACDSKPKAAPPAEQSKASVVEQAPVVDKAPALAPAPEGTVVLDGAYVHRCATPESCPALLQDAGVAHCESLTLGGLAWRLPTVAELEAWKGTSELQGYDVFHWSGSAWEDDPQQFWIFDPGSGTKTTAKPDRKPFTIRCVARP